MLSLLWSHCTILFHVLYAFAISDYLLTYAVDEVFIEAVRVKRRSFISELSVACVTQVSVETQLEQPFFVHGAGWSSCDPARTHARYHLTCRQLSVGDTCISLTTDDFDVSAAAAAERHCYHLSGYSAALLDNSRSASLVTASLAIVIHALFYKYTTRWNSIQKLQ